MKYEDLSIKKAKLDAYRPLPPALVKNLEEWFRVELTYTSNAIEGNTLTRNETALVVEKGITVGGKSLVEHLEATNHAAALDWVQAQLTRKPQALSACDILQIHATILKGIDDENAGIYRNVAVRITGSQVVLPNPAKVPYLMDDFCHWLQTTKTMHPVALAAEAHYRLVTIHPFVDGNGKTARLLMNMILLMCGYPAALIRKRDRLKYINALEQAQLGGSKENYEKIINQAVNRSLEIYLNAVSDSNAIDIPEKPLLKIGELARKSDVPQSTIRHWLKEDLLEVAEITPSGYQLFDSEMLNRIKKIQKLKKQRCTIIEIKQRLEK